MLVAVVGLAWTRHRAQRAAVQPHQRRHAPRSAARRLAPGAPASLQSPVKIERVGPFLWRFRPTLDRGMRVPALVVADDALMAAIRTDASLEQIANGATLARHREGRDGDARHPPGLRPSRRRRRRHRRADGVVSPGAIGFDINCGVRLLRTGLAAADVMPRIPALVDALYASIPTGVGARSTGLAVRARSSTAVLEQGAAWAVAPGHGEAPISSASNQGGPLPAPRSDAVSPHARGAGLRQLGSLGLRQSLPRAAGRRRDPRRARGGRARRAARRARGHDPHRLSRARPSGVHRLPGDDRRGAPTLRHQRPRPPAGLRAGRLPRGHRLPRRDASGRQLRVRQPPGARALSTGQALRARARRWRRATTGWRASTTSPTTSPRKRSTRSTASAGGCSCTAKARRGPFPDSR